MIRQLRARLGEQRAIQARLAGSPGARLDPTARVRSPERLTIGAHSFVDSWVLLHCGGMDWSDGQGGIDIGEHVYIGPGCVLFGAGGIEIGDGALISPGVVITSHQHTFAERDVEIRSQPLEFARVVIERDVWIGANATVLPGVRLGGGSVVGAGAVVTKDVAPGEVVMGVPARVQRQR
jgi:acetyltransferase-like isoleucine patch superfamily enzyme